MVAGDLVNTASRDPVGRRARDGLRRRVDAALDGADDRLRGRRRVRAQGQGGAHSALAGACASSRACAARSSRRGSRRRSSGAIASCARSRTSSTPRADERKAHLVSVTGIAGIGKSRLAWEFYKYFDGIAEHRVLAPRALPLLRRRRDLLGARRHGAHALPHRRGGGAGVRARQAARHARGAHPRRRRAELPRAAPRAPARAGGAPGARSAGPLRGLAALLRAPGSETYPTVLAFEDMQWADASLLDFVEYLLDWSRSHPIFVVTLARPELLERRPTWGAGQRSFTSLYLEPLSQQAMEELLAGLVPGLPTEVRDRILARAEGIPLYAVETVRMLLDRGLLVQDGPAYRLDGRGRSARGAGDAARPHRRAARRPLRRKSGGCSRTRAVLGKTFTRDALGRALGLRGRARAAARVARTQGGARRAGRPALARARPVRLPPGPRAARRLRDALEEGAPRPAPRRRRSPECCIRGGRGRGRRGHRVALPRRLRGRPRRRRRRTRSRARRKRRSCAPASAPSRSPRPPRRGATSSRRRSSPTIRPRELRSSAQAGEMAVRAGDPDAARRLLEESIALYEGQGDTHAAARVSARLGRVELLHRPPRRRAGAAWSAHSTSSRSTSRTRISRSLAATAGKHATRHRRPRACGRAGRAGARHRRGATATRRRWRSRSARKRRLRESRGHHGGDARAASSSSSRSPSSTSLAEQAGTCYFILSDQCFRRDAYEDALGYLDEALALSARMGNRPHEWAILAERTYPLFMLGRWDEALAVERASSREEQTRLGRDGAEPAQSARSRSSSSAASRPRRSVCTRMFSRLEESTDVQERVVLLRRDRRTASAPRGRSARSAR